MPLKTETNDAPTAIFIALILAGVQRAHRASLAFTADFPEVEVEVELVDDFGKRLAAADPEDLPGLFVLLDGNVPVRAGMGASEDTILLKLRREWAATLASTEGGAR